MTNIFAQAARNAPSTEFPYVGPDEGLVLGARNIPPVNGGGDWIVAQPDHWMFEGTGLKKADRSGKEPNARRLRGWPR